ncbi:tubulin delta chain-like [Prorops nasuta]|uniref:tubulin delta chain-like n=1 Tax=Prorops nasuta TaxID=863751 RepID=UPI0034CFD4DF
MLTLQFGQCGNQLGRVLFSKLSEDIDYCTSTGVSYDVNYQYINDSVNKWFGRVTKNNRHLAKAILVDTEEKVINQLCYNFENSWAYCSKNIVCEAGSGSANNWAYGHLVKGQQLSDLVMNCVRLEIEQMDQLDGFLSLLSCAGGTGSGIGSYILDVLREEYRKKTIIAATVLPFSSGEVCLQNYNSLLTLSKFNGNVDTVLIFENSKIYEICKNLVKTDNTSVQDMNNIIAKKLISILQPVNDSSFNLNILSSRLSPHVSYKFATIKSIPYVTDDALKFNSVCSWESYVKYLKQMLHVPYSSIERADSKIKLPLLKTSKNTIANYNYYSCVANILITRGRSSKNDLLITDDLTDNNLFTNWTMNDRFTHFHQTRNIFKCEKFLSLITNNSYISKPLEEILQKAWTLYTHSAFLHQYKQFGLEEQDFLEAFAKIENIINNYKKLTN